LTGGHRSPVHSMTRRAAWPAGARDFGSITPLSWGRNGHDLDYRCAGCRYGVMAMASGLWPVLTGGRAVPVAVRMGVTVPERRLVTYAVFPSGVMAMAPGPRCTSTRHQRMPLKWLARS
jgi:hypothetical protein